MHRSGALVAGHSAACTWGATADKALENAIVVEYVAKMQLQTCTLRGKFQEPEPIPQALLDKHFLRKHGPYA